VLFINNVYKNIKTLEKKSENALRWKLFLV